MDKKRDPERLLLNLVVPGSRPIEGLLLGDEGWRQLDSIAVQHRLIPLLHHHLTKRPDCSPPADLQAEWKEASRRSTLSVLQAQRDLLLTLELLQEIHVDPVLLKGGHLAFAAYPQPGLRPLRDLDLWLPRDRALEAFAHLQSAGFAIASPGDPRQALEQLHQLPLLVAPDGTPIELHVRLFHRGEEPPLSEHVRTWELAGRSVRVPSAALMMLHLIVHAAYDHRFDNGPITLADIAYLLASDRIDEAEWRALAGPWQAGADLIFALLERQGVDPGMARGDTSIDKHVIELVSRLLVQDMADHGRPDMGSGPGIIATLMPSAARRHLLYGADDPGLVHHWRRLIAERLPLLLRSLLRPKARQIGNIDAAYRTWLDQSSHTASE